MKKTLIALAAIAATSAVFAQTSSVSLYGRLDLGMKTSKNGVTSTETTTSLAGNQHGNTTSRLGVRGTEDLGGGLKAGFQYEAKLNADRGDTAFADSKTAFGQTRYANLSLSGGFGKIALGSMENVIDKVRFGYTIDPANRVIFGVADEVGLKSTSTSGLLGTDDENLLMYTSPKMNGFTFQAGLSSEKKNNAAVAAVTATVPGTAITPGSAISTTVSNSSIQKLNSQQLGLTYEEGPWYAAFGYRSVKTTNTLTSAATAVPAVLPAAVVGATIFPSARASNWAFQVSYDFPMVTPYFIYESLKATGIQGTSPAAFNPSRKGNAWSLGAVVPMGAWTPYLEVNRGSSTSYDAPVTALTGTTKKKYSSYELGTSYALSKRTSVYGAINRYNVKGQLNGGVWTPTNKTNAYVLGVRHDF